jgi:hypothetical protein
MYFIITYELYRVTFRSIDYALEDILFVQEVSMQIVKNSKGRYPIREDTVAIVAYRKRPRVIQSLELIAIHSRGSVVGLQIQLIDSSPPFI